MVTLFPSPRFHNQLVMPPDEASVKTTELPANRLVGVPVKAASGGSGAAPGPLNCTPFKLPWPLAVPVKLMVNRPLAVTVGVRWT